jgi:ribonuclease P protein component
MVLFRLCAPELRPEESEFHFAVVASSKVGDAVRRNRAKRLLREALRAHGAELRPAQWLVIVARQSMSDARVGIEPIRSEMNRLLRELDALDTTGHPAPTPRAAR